jgi:hypothetical protein
MRHAAFLGIALTLIGSWGCGGKTTTVTGPDGEKVTVSQNGDKVEGTVIGPDGKKVTYSSGAAGVKMPEGFPKDVPLYPAATVFMSGKQGKEMTVMLKCSDDVQKVAGFYEGRLKENGWAIETTANIGEVSTFVAKKEKRQVTVVISAENITIGVQDE